MHHLKPDEKFYVRLVIAEAGINEGIVVVEAGINESI